MPGTLFIYFVIFLTIHIHYSSSGCSPAGYSFFLSWVSDSCIWANNFLPAGPRVGCRAGFEPGAAVQQPSTLTTKPCCTRRNRRDVNNSRDPNISRGMLQTAKAPATAGKPSANNSRDTNNGRNLSDIRYVISSRTPATAKTPTTEGVIEIEGTPATGLSLSHDSYSYCFFSLTLDGEKIQIQKTQFLLACVTVYRKSAIFPRGNN